MKALGYEDELKEKGIEDPVSHFRAEVARMNAERKAGMERERVREISDVPAARHLGHFALKAEDTALVAAGDMALLQTPSGLRFSLHGLLFSLVYARAMAPCSKLRTFKGVLPQMEGMDASFTLDQL
ncbi:MAG: hypothetical protein DUD39_15305 [Coriobacteriaceae bacterium]|nr:MAG: hypothetical protein DUD39_15305 [Coriobacteriaceae bacterium]